MRHANRFAAFAPARIEVKLVLVAATVHCTCAHLMQAALSEACETLYGENERLHKLLGGWAQSFKIANARNDDLQVPRATVTAHTSARPLVDSRRSEVTSPLVVRK